MLAVFFDHHALTTTSRVELTLAPACMVAQERNNRSRLTDRVVWICTGRLTVEVKVQLRDAG